MNLPTSGPSANCSKLLVSDMTKIFDQNRCFLKDVLVSEFKISYLLDFDYIYYENIEDKLFKQFKSVITNKVLIKSFRNWDSVDFLKVFKSHVISVIQKETVSMTSVSDSLQFAFEFLIQIWIS